MLLRNDHFVSGALGFTNRRHFLQEASLKVCGRPCFICRKRQSCSHREPAVIEALAARELAKCRVLPLLVWARSVNRR